MWYSFETAANHVIDLVAPILLFCPRKLRILGGLIQVRQASASALRNHQSCSVADNALLLCVVCFQILFQVVLILSGNLSFLNWLTIAPAIMCFDDAFLLPLVRPWPFKKAREEIKARLWR